MMYSDRRDFSILVGQILTAINGAEEGSGEVELKTAEGPDYKLCHFQDCCEDVTLAEVVGDIADLIGSPILIAEEVTSRGGDPAPQYPDSWTWTFYKLATVKGHVTLRFLGESNGYYSEEVDFIEVPA